MTATDEGKTLSKLSPFAIHKGVKGIAGGDVTIKRQFGGDIGHEEDTSVPAILC